MVALLRYNEVLEPIIGHCSAGNLFTVFDV